jgi:hypothetical protein
VAVRGAAANNVAGERSLAPRTQYSVETPRGGLCHLEHSPGGAEVNSLLRFTSTSLVYSARMPAAPRVCDVRCVPWRRLHPSYKAAVWSDLIVCPPLQHPLASLTPPSRRSRSFCAAVRGAGSRLAAGGELVHGHVRAGRLACGGAGEKKGINTANLRIKVNSRTHVPHRVV